ncbi:hypothetical protein GY32_22960 [Escherichia coli]|nr:hypothetical protein [Salmonella enterica subsp. enterica serovar Kentucky]EEW0419913.1 hypothetical protein [Escherichia coli]PXF65951.1 hypothetical protein CFK47_25365 [Escherichia coli O157]EEW0750693.1 hypothetical protein [Escherichia coli]EEW4351103.1 hypothetical protein [Escherichia coli]
MLYKLAPITRLALHIFRFTLKNIASGSEAFKHKNTLSSDALLQRKVVLQNYLLRQSRRESLGEP